jgi:hypothetical protein
VQLVPTVLVAADAIMGAVTIIPAIAVARIVRIFIMLLHCCAAGYEPHVEIWRAGAIGAVSE